MCNIHQDSLDFSSQETPNFDFVSDRSEQTQLVWNAITTDSHIIVDVAGHIASIVLILNDGSASHCQFQWFRNDCHASWLQLQYVVRMIYTEAANDIKSSDVNNFDISLAVHRDELIRVGNRVKSKDGAAMDLHFVNNVADIWIPDAYLVVETCRKQQNQGLVEG